MYAYNRMKLNALININIFNNDQYGFCDELVFYI